MSTGERIRDLSDVPSFPAIYAAALDPRRGRRNPGRDGREPVLPGRALRVRRVRIDGARAASFDHLMGGPATERVHPGVLHVLAFPVSLALMAGGDFPFGLLGLVHLRNRILQHRPVRVGELVDVECRARGLAPHRRGWTFEAVSTIHGQDGRIIATDVSTYLAKGRSPSADAGGADSGGSDRPRERPRFEPPRPTGRWRLGAGTGRRYAEVSGDVNPIHMSALSARAFGFPRAIAHGMYTASRAFTEARIDLARPLQWDVEFDAPVTLPGTVLVAFDEMPGEGRERVHCLGWRPPREDRPARRCFETEVRMLD